ncbi:hypothetical protein ACNQF7_04340 [Flavobacterium sp. RSP29]|uniref:hypothetical protein n=1 Tax=Flavobacterium sp. RSP29 TaxID=3401731 RepID=UPI003AAC772E
MEAIGGYFGLELQSGNHYHSGSNCVKLNTGRNSLEYILKVANYSKIYLPYFTCDVLLEPLIKLETSYEFYHVDENLEPIFDFDKVRQNEVFLYTNYFGLKDEYVNNLSTYNINVAIDNAQSFFSKPVSGIDTFYSARKFIGVADGAYLYTNMLDKEVLKKDFSGGRLSHLITRLDKSAEEGYSEFAMNDSSLEGQPILQMSRFTEAVLQSLDYNIIKEKRLENYNFLHANLGTLNNFKVVKNTSQIPMVYPFWTNDQSLRQRLLDNKIYCAKYWPNLKNWNASFLECEMAEHIIHLPVDQRCSIEDMKKIINHV